MPVACMAYLGFLKDLLKLLVLFKCTLDSMQQFCILWLHEIAGSIVLSACMQKIMAVPIMLPVPLQAETGKQHKEQLQGGSCRLLYLTLPASFSSIS